MYIVAVFETDVSGLNILSCKVDAVMSACVSVNRILTACVVISVIQTCGTITIKYTDENIGHEKLTAKNFPLYSIILC